MALQSWCQKHESCSDVATLERRDVPTSRHCRELEKRSIPTSRRSGLVLGRFSAHFEPIIGGFKAQTPSKQKGRRLGLGEGDFAHTLGPRKRLGAVFEDLGEDHEIFGRKYENHHHFDH